MYSLQGVEIAGQEESQQNLDSRVFYYFVSNHPPTKNKQNENRILRIYRGVFPVCERVTETIAGNKILGIEQSLNRYARWRGCEKGAGVRSKAKTA